MTASVPLAPTLIDPQKILEQYASGESTRQIGAKWGISHTRVRHVLLRNGAQLRSKKEANAKFARYNVCVICGKSFRARGYWKESRNLSRKTCSPECRSKLLTKVSLERGFKHGQSQAYYTWRAQKYKKSFCEMCGGKELLEIHHIDRDKSNNKEENIQTLCKPCHALLHYVEDGRGLQGWNPEQIKALIAEIQQGNLEEGTPLPKGVTNFFNRLATAQMSAGGTA